MKVTSATALSLMITATQAMASAGSEQMEGVGLLTTFFIAFGILIVLFQFLPGMALFLGVLKGIFSSEVKTPGEEAARSSRTGL